MSPHPCIIQEYVLSSDFTVTFQYIILCYHTRNEVKFEMEHIDITISFPHGGIPCCRVDPALRKGSFRILLMHWLTIFDNHPKMILI